MSGTPNFTAHQSATGNGGNREGLCNNNNTIRPLLSMENPKPAVVLSGNNILGSCEKKSKEKPKPVKVDKRGGRRTVSKQHHSENIESTAQFIAMSVVAPNRKRKAAAVSPGKNGGRSETSSSSKPAKKRPRTNFRCSQNDPDKHLCAVCPKNNCGTCSNCINRLTRHQACKNKPKELCRTWQRMQQYKGDQSEAENIQLSEQPPQSRHNDENVSPYSVISISSGTTDQTDNEHLDKEKTEEGPVPDLDYAAIYELCLEPFIFGPDGHVAINISNTEEELLYLHGDAPSDSDTSFNYSSLSSPSLSLEEYRRCIEPSSPSCTDDDSQEPCSVSEGALFPAISTSGSLTELSSAPLLSSTADVLGHQITPDVPTELPIYSVDKHCPSLSDEISVKVASQQLPSFSNIPLVSSKVLANQKVTNSFSFVKKSNSGATNSSLSISTSSAVPYDRLEQTLKKSLTEKETLLLPSLSLTDVNDTTAEQFCLSCLGQSPPKEPSSLKQPAAEFSRNENSSSSTLSSACNPPLLNLPLGNTSQPTGPLSRPSGPVTSISPAGALQPTAPSQNISSRLSASVPPVACVTTQPTVAQANSAASTRLSRPADTFISLAPASTLQSSRPASASVCPPALNLSSSTSIPLVPAGVVPTSRPASASVCPPAILLSSNASIPPVPAGVIPTSRPASASVCPPAINLSSNASIPPVPAGVLPTSRPASASVCPPALNLISNVSIPPVPAGVLPTSRPASANVRPPSLNLSSNLSVPLVASNTTQPGGGCGATPLSRPPSVSSRRNSISRVSTPEINDEVTDTETQAAFQQGMLDGTVKLHITKCGVTGPPDTGKSHARALMLGLPRPAQRRSTALATEADQVTPDYSRFTEDMVDIQNTGKGKGCIWKVIKSDSMARMIANTLHELYKSNSQSSDQGATSEQASSDQNSSSGDRCPSVQSGTFSPRQKYRMIMDIMRHLRRMKGKPKRKRKGLNGIHLVYFVDTGGQPQFQEILPNFIKCDVSLLVHNLSQTLDHCPEFNYVVEGKRYAVPEQMKMTNLSIIEQSVRSIASSITGAEKRPHVAIVGTFKDQCNPGSPEYREMLRAKSKQINEQLKPYIGARVGKCNMINPERNNEERIFAIDGSAEGWQQNGESLEKLKSNILQCSEKRKVEVPIRYFIFLQNLLEYAKNKDYVTLEECLHVASMSDICMNDDDVHKALELFNDCNLISYFPNILKDIVFIKPGFLFGKVTDLIVASFRCVSDITTECQANFQRTGVFTAEILDEIKLPNGQFSVAQFLHLLKGLFIIAQVDPNSYFMPCVLPPLQSSSEVLQQYKHCMQANRLDGPLVIAFTHKMSPRGLFCSLLVALASNPLCKLKNLGEEERCRNLVEFELHTASQHNSVGTIAIVDQNSRLEIYTTCSQLYCCSIKEMACEALTLACRNMDYHHEDLYTIGFRCQAMCGCPEPHWSKVLEDAQGTTWKERCTVNLRKRAVDLTKERAVWFKASIAAVANDDNEFFRMLCNEVSPRTNKWREIAINLDIAHVEIERIEVESHGRIEECFVRVFQRWQRLRSPPFTMATIICVLKCEQVGEQFLARTLREKYCEL